MVATSVVTSIGVSSAPGADQAAWLGDSEMAGRVLAFDWRATPLGPIEGWPPSLRGAVATCLRSRFQMAVYWGPDLNCIYNDAERDILGGLHPQALGMPARALLRDSWKVVGPQLTAVMQRGGATWAEDQPLTFARHDALEVGYFTYSYSPIIDERGDVGGVLLVSQDTTARVIAERRLDILREVAMRSMDARTQRQACELAAQAFEGKVDLPFTKIYLMDPDGQTAACVAASGMTTLRTPSEHRVRVAQPAEGLGELFAPLTGERAGGVLADARLFTASTGEERPPVAQAYAAPARPGRTEPVAGFFVAGVRDEFVADASHRDFLEMLAFGVGRSVSAARAREAERDQARAVATLDRAKTALFSNTSHELRTPLALILGPLDELLDDPNLLASAREPLVVARRSAVRMLNLVTTMLDFSAIEAGQDARVLRPTDLAQLTRDVAAMFRSTAKRAGLRLSVSCPPLAEPAYVDREAWERIISNLISNAVKFTPAGTIDVHLSHTDGSFVLTVQDTGIGIAQPDLDRVFSRFYRASDARARTHEGSGIGLALVRELVSLHCGTITAHRRRGGGTRMVLRIPAGGEHPGRRVDEAEISPGRAAALYVEEADGWLTDDVADTLRPDTGRLESAVPRPHPRVPGDGERVQRVLVVEDNADMRDYLRRLLEPYFAVDVARNGSEALKMVVVDPPSIVITDAMMPGLDGLGLLQSIRSQPGTREIPVIVISARADVESRLQAINLGADEYVVKPFSPRELVARLRGTLESASLRSKDAEARGQERERARRDDELEALLEDLRAAQRRVATAAGEERQRIERNLHDGAQQRLMAIRLEVGLLGERLERDPAGSRAELDRLHGELDEALDELRELAHGLYPPLLASDGLHAALAAATLRAAIPVTLEGGVIDRVPRAIESAAYFACLEALQNAAKHGGPGTRATVVLDLSGETLTFSVSDDGRGFGVGATTPGQGLVNLQDRVGALGGSAEISSVPGQGTTVRGRIPVP